MQNRHDGILSLVNKKDKSLNILTAPTHERTQSWLESMPHTFYLFQANGLKPWNSSYAKLPKNYVLLSGEKDQIRPDMIFHVCIAQNRFGQYQIFKPISEALNIPLITIEHTLPVPNWSKQQREQLSNMRGDINVFISKYSASEWGFSNDDKTVRIIPHGIDSNIFNNTDAEHNDGKILSVMNDAINRTWCLGTDIYFRITKDLPVNPIGDTPGFSKAAKNLEDLINNYKKASVFVNCSTISPIPTSLLEAAATACPIVTKATCAIPEYFKNGENCWISNDEDYLRDRLIWCLNNPEEAKILGIAARKMILEQFSLKKHIEAWNSVFNYVCKY